MNFRIMYSVLVYIIFLFSCSTTILSLNVLRRGTQFFSKKTKNKLTNVTKNHLKKQEQFVTKLPKTSLGKENLLNLREQQTNSVIKTAKLKKDLKKTIAQVKSLSDKTETPDVVKSNIMSMLSTQQTKSLPQSVLKQEVQNEVNNQIGNDAPEEIKLQLSDAISELIFSHNVLKEVVKESIQVKGEIIKQVVTTTLKTIEAQKNVVQQDTILSIEESKQPTLALSKPEQKSLQTAIDLTVNPEERAKINEVSETLHPDPELKQELDNFIQEENVTKTDLFVETVNDIITQKEPDIGSELVLQQDGYGSLKLESDSANLIAETLPEIKDLFEKNSSLVVINPENNVLNDIIHTDSQGTTTLIYDGLKNITEVPEKVSDVVDTIIKIETEKALKEILTPTQLLESPLKRIEEIPTIEEVSPLEITEIIEEPAVPEKIETKLSLEEIEAIEKAAETEKARVEKALEHKMIPEVSPEQLKELEQIEKETNTFSIISKKNTRIFEQQSDVFNKKRILDTQHDTKIARPEKTLLNDTIEQLKIQQSEVLQDTQKKIQDVVSKKEIPSEVAETEIEVIKTKAGEKLTEQLEHTHDIIDTSNIKSEIAKEYANDTASLITDTAAETLDTITYEGKNTLDYIRLQDKNIDPEVTKQILDSLKGRLRTETEKYKKIVNQLARMRTQEQRQQKTQEKEISEETRNAQKTLLAALVTTITTIISTITVNNYLKEEVDELQNLMNQTEELLQEEQKKPEEKQATPEITEETPTPEEKQATPEITETPTKEKKITPKRLIPKINQYMGPMINQFSETKNKIVPIALETPQSLKPPLKTSLKTPAPPIPPTERPTGEFVSIDNVQQNAFQERYLQNQEHNLNALTDQLKNTEQKVEQKLDEIEVRSEQREETTKNPSISHYKKMSDREKKMEDEKHDRAFDTTTRWPDYYGFDYEYDDFDFDRNYDFFDGDYDFDFDAFDDYDDFNDFDFLSNFYDFDETTLDIGRKKSVEKEEIKKPMFDQIALEGEFEMPEKVTQKKERKTERIRQSEIKEDAPEIKETIPLNEEESMPRAAIPTYKTYLAPALIAITITCAILFYFLI